MFMVNLYVYIYIYIYTPYIDPMGYFIIPTQLRLDGQTIHEISTSGPTQSGNNKKKERPLGLTAMIFDMDMVGHTDDSVSIQSRRQVSCRSSCEI